MEIFKKIGQKIAESEAARKKEELAIYGKPRKEYFREQDLKRKQAIIQERTKLSIMNARKIERLKAQNRLEQKKSFLGLNKKPGTSGSITDNLATDLFGFGFKSPAAGTGPEISRKKKKKHHNIPAKKKVAEIEFFKIWD